MKSFFAALTRHPLGLLGTALVTASALLILTLTGLELVGLHGSPYIGILAYLVLPGIFLLGLLLIPLGVARARRREREAEERGEAPPAFPVLDLNVGSTRNKTLLFLFLTAVNVVVLVLATYKGVEFMDTTAFCGESCHSVMAPEYTAYQRSPHARVKCVSCHIGPGADWFVKSKLSGSWQVVSVLFDLYPRPIPAPIENLRPARETCEQCHWPTKFVGDKLVVRTHYADDEENTELKSVLLLRVGGLQGRTSQGIHWHVDPGVKIRYLADESRERVYDVEMTLADGTGKTFRIDEKPEEPGHWREMDCVDCHNRPSHIYRMPEAEIEAALEDGRIDRFLPFVRREAIRAMNGTYDSHDAARAGIADTLTGFYRERYPKVAASRGAAIDDAGRVAGELYAANVFPSMNVAWGTYPNHIGHADDGGCFRCHDDLHEAGDGSTISQDCDTCHSLLALEEEDPEILADLNP